jgi:hypothetical protein
MVFNFRLQRPYVLGSISLLNVVVYNYIYKEQVEKNTLDYFYFYFYF